MANTTTGRNIVVWLGEYFGGVARHYYGRWPRKSANQFKRTNNIRAGASTTYSLNLQNPLTGRLYWDCNGSCLWLGLRPSY